MALEAGHLRQVLIQGGIVQIAVLAVHGMARDALFAAIWMMIKYEIKKREWILII